MLNRAKYQEILLKMRKEVLESVEQEVRETRKPQSVEIGDDVDYASEEREREFLQLLHQRHNQRLGQIDKAIEKLANNEYGICEGCQEPISEKRIRAIPLTLYCIECQIDMEIEQKANTKGRQEHLF